MIRNFRHKGLEKYFTAGSKAGIAVAHEKRLRLILFRLNGAKEPKDMNLPGLDLHRLHGIMEGFWALSVTGNWRIIFRFDGNDVRDVNYLDYH
ncbi:MAG: type II toxin-antitoxin system RelE/ParE family toxin [Nitrospinae bacterium]|nr:type II toxin-antitoxin system RelE/ParE family toxin [Nitrospinota bacterium]